MAYNKSIIDAKSRATIETSYPLFIIHTNHVTTLPDTPLYTLCQQIYTTALHNLSLPQLVPLDDILTAIFDPAHRAFVLPSPSPASPSLPLSDDARGVIFAQAIAGLLTLLRSVTQKTSEEGVRAALRRFAEGEERGRVLAEVEAWHGWGDCFEKAQIGGMIMKVVGVKAAAAAGEEKVAGAADVSVVEVAAVDEIAEAPELFNDGPHMRSEFGVPGQFQILALN